ARAVRLSLRADPAQAESAEFPTSWGTMSRLGRIPRAILSAQPSPRFRRARRVRVVQERDDGRDSAGSAAEEAERWEGEGGAVAEGGRGAQRRVRRVWMPSV